jgi:hypothetical protein
VATAKVIAANATLKIADNNQSGCDANFVQCNQTRFVEHRPNINRTKGLQDGFRRTNYKETLTIAEIAT